MKKSELKEFIKGEILNEMAIQEMAKIAGDLKSSIEKVISDNPDLENLPLKKAIKADPNVQSALGDQTLFDNQLNKFIALAKGEREVGQRGRKADPNKEAKPKSPTGKRGRPATPKKKDSAATTSKLGGRKYYAKKTDGDSDEPSSAELRKLASSGGDMGGSKDALLKQQEKTKLVKAFLKDLRDKGIVDASNKVIDKEKYDAAWAEEKPKIQAIVNQIKEASKEEVENQKELNKELEKTSELVSKIRIKEQDEDEPTKADLKKTKGLAKAKEELASLTKEMKSLVRKYKEAEGEDKQKIVDDLKSKTKLKKELEFFIEKSL